MNEAGKNEYFAMPFKGNKALTVKHWKPRSIFQIANYSTCIIYTVNYYGKTLKTLCITYRAYYNDG